MSSRDRGFGGGGGGRLFRILITALVAISAVFVATPATAYTPATFAPAAGDTATITAALIHSAGTPSTKNPPIAGDTFNYVGTFAVSGTPTGSTSTTTITIYADANAPFSGPTGTFTLDGTSIAPASATCSATTCTYTFNNIASGNLVLTKQATMKTPLPDGTVILASATVKVTTKPAYGINNVSSSPIPAGQCSGPYTFVQKVEPGGAWLVDMKFGDLAGQGKVGLTQDGDTVIRAWNASGLPAGSDTIKFVDGSGNDITATVMANATYRSSDPSSPYYIGLAPGGAGQYSTTRWIDSLNWPYDPSTWTGNTWLPVGTTITVTRNVTYQNCAPGGFTTDGDTSRKFGIATSVARPITEVVADAVDGFATPGYRPPASCVDQMFISSNVGTGATTTTYSAWKFGSAPASEGPTSGISTRSDAIAATSNYPSYIFSLDYSSGILRVIDTASDTELTKSPSTTRTLISPGWPNNAPFTVLALAFAPDGTLYAVASTGQVAYLTSSQVSSYLAGDTVAWTLGTRIEAVSGTFPTSVHDVAFDGDGNLWVAYSYSNADRRVGTVSTSSLQSAGTNTTLTEKVNLSSIGQVRGLAFLGGKLYLGLQSGTNGTLYEIAWTASTVTATAVSQTTSKFSSPNLSDFASCSYPTKVAPPTGPANKVQKSVINPDGSIAPAGTTGAARTVNPDGTVTVEYVVTVTAVGTTAGSYPSITDTVTVPSGFAINKVTITDLAPTPPVTTDLGAAGTFTIAGAQLDPTGATAPVSRSFKISVTAKAANLAAVNWTTAGTCNTTGGGTPGAGGFFNLVSMNSDSDGVDNNDACAPVTSTGTVALSLIKRIVDANGNDLPARAADAQYFTLTAAGPYDNTKPTNGNVLLTGESMTSGAIATQGTVVPGIYLLNEQPKGTSTVPGGYTFGTWSCANSSNPAVNIVAINPNTGAPQVTLASGMNVTCTVTNTPKPKVKIVKNATSAIAGNTHIGTTVTPNADGTFTANYTVTVTNLDSFIGNTGPITDYFVPPAGTVWDGTKTATIAYLPGTTGATLLGGQSTATAIEMRNGVSLALSVQKLPAGASVSFTIAIPLKLDNTVAAGQTLTNAQLNASNLGSCAPLTSPSGLTYTDATKGIPNTVALTGEDLTYNDIPLQDNVACIPVVVPMPQFKVEKSAPATYNADGTVATWATAGSTGASVQVAADGTVAIQYRIRVTNSGTVAGFHPAVNDTSTLPGGFTLTSVTLKDSSGTVITSSTTSLSFTVPAGQTQLASGSFADYFVTVVAKATSVSSTNWTVAGRCDTNLGGTASYGGFFNQVTMTGDTDGSDNNDACVPVTPPAPQFKVQKSAPATYNADGSVASWAPAGTTGASVKVAADGSVTVTYQVVVTNSGGVNGTHPAVTDQWTLPGGFTINSVTLNGNPVSGSPFTIPAGTATMAPNATATYLVVVKATASNLDAVNWTVAGRCDNNLGGTAAFGGFFNVVTMTGDTDGVDNNDACVPVTPPAAQFKVQKSAPATYNADGTVATWSPAGTTGASVAVAADGSVTVSYQVVVTNSGTISGTHPAITDQWTLPTGFSISSVTLSGSAVTGNPFTIPAGTTTLAPNATATYLVVVKGTANFTTVDWTKAGTCNTTAGGDATAGGFFNKVTMTGDTDGADNNDACVPVTPPTKTIQLHKFARNCNVTVAICDLTGASFAVYTVDPATNPTAQPIPNGITANTGDTSRFTSVALQIGSTYWLVETNAPDGFHLLAEPIKFTVTSTGITLAKPATTAIFLTSTNSFGIEIENLPKAELPQAGGSGPLPYSLAGLALLLAGLAYQYKNSRHRGRHATH